MAISQTVDVSWSLSWYNYIQVPPPTDHIYQWRLLIKEYGAKIIYDKGAHNSVAGAISQLDFTQTPSKSEERQNWMILAKRWCALNQHTYNSSTLEHNEVMKQVFANRSYNNEIYPLTAQKKDKAIEKLRTSEKYKVLLIEQLDIGMRWSTASHGFLIIKYTYIKRTVFPAILLTCHKRCSKPEACRLSLLSRQDFDK